MKTDTKHSEHTPGPWKWTKARTQRHLQDSTGSCFAQVSMPTTVDYDANAALIAAAPELLEACELAYAALQAASPRIAGRLFAAIAKAKG